MWSSYPLFGSALILCILLVAGYTFTVSVVAGARRDIRALTAARLSGYATVAFIAVTVLALAYAFVSHDFRIRYVTRYSDRTMPTVFLFTALWGGQDGSILWWLFLLSLYIGACIKWMGLKHRILQPYVIATLMVVVFFFCILMGFAANPFSTNVGGAKMDGDGLNPLLQNFYMIIHPPSLYTGFVGCTIPFAFAIAALITGKLDNEWIAATRKWMLFAWFFLAMGNMLGMLWAYEELGWGGYWAWDPVENAAFMPFLVASAYLHSAMIQERRGMFKVWNVFLICLTFFMTIFGTFLTRSGAIASVHSFAQSSIGTYFVYFLAFIAAACLSLVLYRWPELRDLPQKREYRIAALVSGWVIVLGTAPGLVLLLSKSSMSLPVKAFVFSALMGGAVYVAVDLVYRRMTMGLPGAARKPHIESVLSRDFTFLLNNWALIFFFLLFVLVSTTFPMISEALWNEKVTVGPPYYNAWVQPIGLTIYMLMGVGTLFGWKKTSTHALRKAFVWPVGVTMVAAALHLLAGKSLGFPAWVPGEAVYSGAMGAGLRVFNGIAPLLGVSVAVFNAVVIFQEFYFLYRARSKTTAGERTPKILFYAGVLPGVAYTLLTLSPTSRRRYGGYIVHLGMVVMLLGFTGQSWNLTKEVSLAPNDSMEIGAYVIKYKGPRMEVDESARKIFADLHVWKNGKELGDSAPAKFIYKKAPQSPTTEVSMLHTFRDDLYMVVGSINPETKVATFQAHVNPLVSWIWFGFFILFLGSVVCLWPELASNESRAWRLARGTASVAGALIVGTFLALMPTQAFAFQTSSLHAGSVEIKTSQERDIFSSLRCMCGGCERLPLSNCACTWADDARAKLRKKMAEGETRDKMLQDYAKEFGTTALTVPPNTGGMQAIYLFPIAAAVFAGFGLAVLMRRLRRNSPQPAAEGGAAVVDAYDSRLDDELAAREDDR